MKFQKPVLILSILLILFLCIGSVSALENQTDDSGENEVISIDESLGNSTDESVGDGMLGNPDDGSFNSLKSKIGNASDGSVIYLENDYIFDASADSEGISISKSITIYGNNYTIDAQGYGRIFNIASGKTVNLYDITFKNGNSDKGGAIYVADDFSGVLNATFINNTAISTGKSYMGGGAIYVEGSVSGNLTGTFENNRASYDYVKNSGGGAIYIMNGVSGNLTGTFINNSAKDGCVFSGGGAIYINLGGVSGNLIGTFENNRVDFVGGDDFWVNSGGGAIYINQGDISGNLIGTFVNNTADADGGAIYTWSGDISGNLIGTFINNAANTHGGAISTNYFTFSGNLAGNFVNNTARYGGAIDLGYADIPCTIKNCNFTNNKADKGGAIHSEDYDKNVENCNFVNNTASYGGAVSLFDNCEVENCNFVNNTAGYGGAVYFFDNCEVENCNFAGNNASVGSAIYFEFEHSTNTISNSCFLNNRANAGALEVTKNENKITIAFIGNDNLLNAIYSNAEITFTNVTYWGANGIMNTNSYTPAKSNREVGQNITVEIYDSNGNLVENVTLVTDNNGQVKYDFIKLSNGNYTYKAYHIEDSYYTYTEKSDTFTLNSVLGDFNRLQSYINGADANSVLTLCYDYTFTIGSDENLTEGIVIDKPLTINGNGHTIDALQKARIFNITASNVVLNNITFTNATASYYGGAVFSDYYINNVTVSNCNFSNNKASGNDTYGGAIYIYDGNVKNCSFSNNKASGNDTYGGAIYIYGGNVENCNFNNNSASDKGGAIYISWGNVENCNFNNNSASDKGGAIYIFEGNVENCIFTNNTAYEGGAVFLSSSGNITNCNFTNNEASSGGAVFIAYSCNVTDCNFTNNSASDGGAIRFFCPNNIPIVSNCNFINNTAVWGGALSFDFSGTVTDCNFTGNNATWGSAIYFESNKLNNVSNSRFLNNRANAEALKVTINENNITITFTGNDNLLNAIYSGGDVTFTNVTYWSANGINNTGISEIKPSRSNREAGQNITVSVVINDEIVLSEVKVTDEKGMVVLNIDGVENYYIAAHHDTDSYYTEVGNITSNMIYNVNVISQTTNNRTVNITAKSNIYNEVMPGKLLFILPNGDEINATYDSNGTWWALHTFDDAGDYNVSASYIGLDDVVINNGTISIRYDASVDVNNRTLELFINDTFTIVATTTPEGLNVTYVPDDSGVYSVDENGTVIALREGEGSVLIKVGGDGKYAENYTVVNVTVYKNLIISAPDLTKYYKGPEKFVVNVTDSKNNPLADKSVNITINGVTYYRTTDENGTASLDINLNSGEYLVNVVVDDEKVNSTVTVKATIDASDVVKVFRNGTQYYATFVDVNGTPLDHAAVSFNINGRIYNDTTDKYGIAKLNINLGAGEYIITATNTVTGEMKSNVIKVIPLIESGDLTKYYKNDSQFVVRIHSDNGSYVGAGEEVKFNINGIFYTRTTNATGHAKLDINLPQGSYIVTTYYRDYSHGNGIEVLPILNASDLSMKYMDGSQFKVKLVDGEGNPYSNQNVTFNINGIFYKRTTDSDGVAKLNIELMPGEYIITSSYNGCNIANTINVSD